MSLRRLASSLAIASVNPNPKTPNGRWGSNKALYPRSTVVDKTKIRVGQVNAFQLNASSLMQALRSAAPQPANSKTLALPTDQSALQHLIAKRQIKEIVPLSYVFTGATADGIADNAVTLVTITNTVGDATLLDFVVSEDMDGWNLTTFAIGSLGYNMLSGETAARVFAANAIRALNLGSRLFARNDTITYTTVNRTGAAGMFTASFPARLVNPPCVDD